MEKEKKKKAKKDMGRVEKFALIAMILILSCTLIYSTGNIVFTLVNNHESEQTFAELESMIITEPQGNTSNSEDKNSDKTDSSGEAQTITPTLTPAEKYSKLSAENDDFIGWLKIPDTVVNYPVMQTPNNEEYYLHKDFYKKYSFAGTPFVQANCVAGKQSWNTILYGHNMNNGSMFTTIKQYRYKDFLSEHKYIYFDTLEEYGKYEVMAVIITKATKESDFPFWEYTDLTDEERFDKFMLLCEKKTVIKTGVTATYGDKFLTLATCHNSKQNGRLIVVAKSCSPNPLQETKTENTAEQNAEKGIEGVVS